ncbi:MAG: pyridoxal-phosphate dependent enzyme, partial [Candidatus Hodarchaeota archaeon]
SFRGTATILKKYKPNIKIYAVEPAESPVLSEGRSGSHGIGGIGIGFTPPLWNPGIVDDIISISTIEAKEMARRLVREEGLFAGISSGANVAAAIKIAKRLNLNATVVTLLVDSGLKYLSGDLYK